MTPTGWVFAGWQLGIVVNLVILVVLLALVAVFWAKCRRWLGVPNRDRGEGYAFAAVITGICALIELTVFIIGAIPFQPQYLKLYRVETTVLSVSNVMDDASGDLTRTPVVELEGVDRPVVIDDPRIVRLEGADLVLTCTIGWHYQAADTYSCAIREVTR